jgi:trk system potassium uptake protein TrkH
MTLILVFGGAILFAILEWNNPNTIGNMSVGDKILNSFFQSITTRTAGIATLDQNLLTSGSVALTIILMFIGGAPNSTAGGVKLTTFFILILFIFKSSNSSGDIRLKDRRIGRKVIVKALKIIFFTVISVTVGVVLLAVFEGGKFPVINIIYECVSAISTVGLTMGITPLLSLGSKLVLMGLMFAGRVGILTIIMAIFSKKDDVIKEEIEYTNTDIMVG